MEIKINVPELTELVNELRLIREALTTIRLEEPTKRTKSKKEVIPVEIVPVEIVPVETVPAFTISEVREFLAGLMTAGKQPQVKALFVEMGVSKLGEVIPARYPELMELAGKL